MVAEVGYQDISTIQYSYSEIVRMDLKDVDARNVCKNCGRHL